MRPALSARQEECLRLTAFRTDREIAAVLGISEATVKKHVHEACQRLGVKRRKAALAMLPSVDGLVRSEYPARPVTPVVVSPTVEPTVEQHTADPGLTGRLGYRPPPRDAFARVAMIAGMAVVVVATTTTLTHMMGDYHRAIGKLSGSQIPAAATVAGATVYR